MTVMWPMQVLLTHGDSVVKVPPTCLVVGYSGDIIAALQHSEYPVFGVQFHPEVQLTSNGTQMIRNFLYKVWCSGPPCYHGNESCDPDCRVQR